MSDNLRNGAIPPPTYDNFLERHAEAGSAASSFKQLMQDLAVTEVWDDNQDYRGSQEADTSDDERIDDANFWLLHTHYQVKPSRVAEAIRTTGFEATIGLSTTEGGRFYQLIGWGSLFMAITVTYYEDHVPRDLDVLSRFQVVQEIPRRAGISPGELTRIAGMVDDVKAMQKAGRLVTVECDDH